MNLKKYLIACGFVSLISCAVNAQIITTYAGLSNISSDTITNSCSMGSTPATATKLNRVTIVRTDHAGNVYTTEWYCNTIKKISPSGIMTVVAGNGTTTHSPDGALATAGLSNINGFNIDNAGNLYIAESAGSGCWLRKVNSAGILSTIAGGDTAGFSGDNGPATAARFNGVDVAFDAAGNIYIADLLNERIRKINAAGIITTIAGNGTSGYMGDNGPATNAELKGAISITADDAGNVYCIEQFNHIVRKIATSGTITTLVGPSAIPTLNSGGLLVNGGSLYMSDPMSGTVRKINTTTGAMTVLAGSASHVYSGDNGLASAAGFNAAFGIAGDAAGNMYVADDYRIRKITNMLTAVNTVTPEEQAALRLWPSPNKGAFTIYIPSAINEAAQVVISNIVGQQIEMLTADTNKEVNMSINAAPGIYFVTTMTGQVKQTAKVVVQ